MSNSLKRILTYSLGYFTIFESISLTGIRLKWWQVALIIVGVIVINLSDVIFPRENNDNFRNN